jgi:hypothetical protein
MFAPGDAFRNAASIRRAIVKGLRLLLAGLALLGSGSGALALECRARQMVVVEMLFGRKIGDRIAVSEAAFSRFVDREIATRFPDGLTVLSTDGRWRDTKRKVVIREPGKMVMLAVPDEPKTQEHIDAIVAAYKARFRQQSVGVLMRQSCVSF